MVPYIRDAHVRSLELGIKDGGLGIGVCIICECVWVQEVVVLLGVRV